MSVIDNIRFTFLYVEFFSMGKAWIYPESYIPYNIFRYIVKGRAEFCINGTTTVVREGQIVYIPCGCMMSCASLSDSFEFYSIRFSTSVLYDGEDVLDEYYGIARITENEGEDRYFREIDYWAKQDTPLKKCFIRGYLDLLIGSLSIRGRFKDVASKELPLDCNTKMEAIQKNRKNEKKKEIDLRIQTVADYIVQHPQENYSPLKMAGMVKLSTQRFGSLFKLHMGKSPMQYVREIRLTTAARLLLISSENVNDIAYEVGYEDANYFIREFKSAFGFTPNQYRKKAKY